MEREDAEDGVDEVNGLVQLYCRRHCRRPVEGGSSHVEWRRRASGP